MGRNSLELRVQGERFNVGRNSLELRVQGDRVNATHFDWKSIPQVSVLLIICQHVHILNVACAHKTSSLDNPLSRTLTTQRLQ